LEGLRSHRPAALIAAGVFLLVGLLLSAFYFWSPHATLRVTTGLPGTVGQRFISAFVAVSTAIYPQVHYQLVPVANIEDSAKAMEDGKVDLAIVRTDISPPTNGQTVAILRRDVVAIIVPSGSSIKDPSELSGKTIAIPESLLQEYNSKTLDTILSYFNVSPEKVKRVFLPIAEIGPEIHKKHVAAALAMGPIGPGEATNVVASIAKATKSAPELLAIDQADAIVKRFPGFESIDVPEGAFKGRPPTPDDTVTCLAVTYRMVVPERMLNVIAGLIGRSILQTREKLMAALPLVSQIEAPDPDDKSPVLPVHPGVSAYLSSGDQSFLDSLQQYLYVIGIPMSLFGSLGAVVFGQMRNKRLEADQTEIYQLLVIAESARTAEAPELDNLEGELNATVANCVKEGASDATQLPASTLAIDHARRAIDRRRGQLNQASAPETGVRKVQAEG
jgi:TRAP-type uncharacterized transport system substrate-binding protein